jgi:hypothetical protein
MPNLMTRQNGRGFVLSSSKLRWNTPKLRRFESPEEALEYYGRMASAADGKKLESLIDQVRNVRGSADPPAKARRTAHG